MPTPPTLSLGAKGKTRAPRISFRLPGDDWTYECRRLTLAGLEGIIDMHAKVQELAEGANEDDVAAKLETYAAMREVVRRLVGMVLRPDSAEHLIGRMESTEPDDDEVDEFSVVALLPEILGLITRRPTESPSDS